MINKNSDGEFIKHEIFVHMCVRSRVVDISRVDAGELEIQGSLKKECGCTEFLQNEHKQVQP